MKLNKEWKFKESFPTISAYVTSYNCIKNGYPIIAAVRSFAWVDEIVVVDGGSEDDTVAQLEALGLDNLSVYTIPIDWSSPGKDGIQKAMARAMCSKEYSIQFDADEICLGSPDKWRWLAKDMEVAILDLPVLEPFGNICELRLNPEHNPVKWRIFKNVPEITHGIPLQDQIEVGGKVYSKGMSDGCFPIHIVHKQLLPSKMTPQALKMKHLFTKCDSPCKGKCENEYAEFVQMELSNKSPMVLHLGHVDLEAKIKLFLNEWRFWWAELYNKDPEDLSMYWPKGPPPFKIQTGGIPRGNKIFMDDSHIKARVRELRKQTPSVVIEELSKYGDLTNAKQGLSV